MLSLFTRNGCAKDQKYKGYVIRPTGSDFLVMRNKQKVTTEPTLQLAKKAIDERIYSKPDFNKSGYQTWL